MTQSVRAILICLVAYLCFDLMSIHVRYLSARYSAQELSVYRNIFGILPSIVLLWYTRELSIRPADYKLVQWKLALSRGFVVAIAQLMFYTALGQLELATVSALGTNKCVVRGVAGDFDVSRTGWVLALGRGHHWVHRGNMDCPPRNRCIFMDRAFANWGCVLLCLRRCQFAQL